MAAPAKPASLAARFDQTWQVGTAWGLVLFALTVIGVYLSLPWSYGMSAAMLLPILGYVVFLAWLEKGVTK